VLLSRTDSIGDVVLTLPMAGVIKEKYPQCRVLFLGRTYTRDVIGLCSFVDEFINYDDLEKLDRSAAAQYLKDLHIEHFIHVFPKKEIALMAKKAGIPQRAGTTNRLFHLFTCNRLIRLSRKNSGLHESQLNLKLLSALGINKEIGLERMFTYYGIKQPATVPAGMQIPDGKKLNIIIHPASKGSAKEWGLENFKKFVQSLPQNYRVFVSGTKEDGEKLRTFINTLPSVIDLTGKLSLAEFIYFISKCDALIAASTGPLHIAAALDKTAIGLFSPRRPIHPGRWQPVGKNAHYLVFDENCESCAQGKDCDCISRIDPQQIVALLKHDLER
jgi:heptosyltransferase III